MILIGRYLSPFVRRVAVYLNHLEIPFERRPLGVIDDFDALRAVNPLGRVPALVLPDGEVLTDSGAILDHLDEIAGERALTPRSGPERRAVKRLEAMAVGAMEKTVAGYYELTRRPEDKRWDDWAERVTSQARGGLAALDAALAGPRLVGDRLTQADVSAALAWSFAAKVLPAALPAQAARLAALAEACEALPTFAAARD